MVKLSRPRSVSGVRVEGSLQRRLGTRTHAAALDQTTTSLRETPEVSAPLGRNDGVLPPPSSSQLLLPPTVNFLSEQG